MPEISEVKKALTRPPVANLSKIAYEFFVTNPDYKKGWYASKRKLIWIAANLQSGRFPHRGG